MDGLSRHVKYQTYDVTAQVKDGKNAVTALLAPGWYETPLEWFQQPNNYGDTPPALQAQLRMSTRTAAWSGGDGLELAGSTSYFFIRRFMTADSDAREAARLNFGGLCRFRWKSVSAIDPKPISIEAQDFPSIRVERELIAKTVTEPKPGVYVYDFGQNFSGVERLRVQGPRERMLQLRFAEIVNADGTIYTDNLRTAKATDHFILSGNGLRSSRRSLRFMGSGMPSDGAGDCAGQGRCDGNCVPHRRTVYSEA